ncbi:MICOS complex subunit mic25a isoform X2 [Engraulis encrasicolus]|uniref:MICOS complex subunit mic25a isoform X2 n=1 Tax=Engraulis encrasicolus TaxID=184585 RepID=UPI002FD308CA
MMGSGESTTRKVSFGVDDEHDTVRILRGVKISGDVLQRMKEIQEMREMSGIPKTQANANYDNKENIVEPQVQSSPQQKSSDPEPQAQPHHQPEPQPQPQPDPKPQPQHQTSTGHVASDTSEELKRRYERQQTLIQEELARIARREREASRQDLSRILHRERSKTNQETGKAAMLRKLLEKKESELKTMDAFYKEQISQLEKRNLERYKASQDQFHSAVTRSESHVRARNTEPVCTVLQSQIMRCYQDNREETLNCSDLAKEYIQCINKVKKNLLVNHG